MFNIVDTGNSHMVVLPDGTTIEDVGVPEIISKIYHRRDQFESTRYTGDVTMKTAIAEYFELVSRVNRLAEELVNMIPRLGNLMNSNNIAGQLEKMTPETVIPEINASVGRIIELQRGWSAMFVALNTPVEIIPGVYATPIEIIFRRDVPNWVSEYYTSIDTGTSAEDNPGEVTN